ncbi:MAG: hypothetical protein H5T86_14025, partial [Armatimonadetes bacterium]|nr:hypothetical protein [Armatimonadota bacterium]
MSYVSLLCLGAAALAVAAERVQPVYPEWVVSGLRVLPAGGMKIRVEPGVAQFGNRRIEVAGAELTVAVPETIQVRDEKLVLKTEKPQGWAHCTSLPQCTCFPDGAGTPLPYCLQPGSVRVKKGPGDSELLQEGHDYLLDETWAKLGRVEGGAIGESQPVFVDYVIRLQRIDSVVVRWDGKVQLRQGAGRKTCPVPPPIGDGEQRLANIFVWYATSEIVPGLIFPCGPSFPEPDQAERERRQSFVQRTLSKLRYGEDLTIVTWGDSVTVGGDALPMDRYAFAYRFADELRHKYPQARIKLVNAGIGGSSRATRLAGLEKDV